MTTTVRRWPLLLIASPAAVAIWSGSLGLGGLCGFGPIHPLPGTVGSFTSTAATSAAHRTSQTRDETPMTSWRRRSTAR